MEFNLTNKLTLTTSLGGSEKLLYAIQSGDSSASAPYTKFKFTAEAGVRMEIVDLADSEKMLIIESSSLPHSGTEYNIPAPGDNKWVDIRFDNATDSVVVYLIELINKNHPDCSTSDTVFTSSVATYLCNFDLNSKKELFISYNANSGLTMRTT